MYKIISSFRPTLIDRRKPKRTCFTLRFCAKSHLTAHENDDETRFNFVFRFRGSNFDETAIPFRCKKRRTKLTPNFIIHRQTNNTKYISTYPYRNPLFSHHRIANNTSVGASFVVIVNSTSVPITKCCT